jgi:Tat protein translocase TatB subunit
MELFGIGPLEFILLIIIALVVLGPERLPEVARTTARFLAQLRRLTAEISREFAEDFSALDPNKLLEETPKKPYKVSPSTPPQDKGSTDAAEPATPTPPPVVWEVDEFGGTIMPKSTDTGPSPTMIPKPPGKGSGISPLSSEATAEDGQSAPSKNVNAYPPDERHQDT